jgi:hypothetical protein
MTDTKRWTVSKSHWPNGLVFSLSYLHHKGKGFTTTIGLGRYSYHFAYLRHDRNQAMTDEELTAIEARANAATMGPWKGKKNSGVVSKHTHFTVFDTGCGCCTEKDLSADDAAFIAAARADVPALIDEVRRIQAERDALRTELAKYPTLDGALLIPCKTLAVQP